MGFEGLWGRDRGERKTEVRGLSAIGDRYE